jgi:hypothetical protein
MSNNRHRYQRTPAGVHGRRGRSDRVKVVVRHIARWLRDEEAAGSNPATPTQVKVSYSLGPAALRFPDIVLTGGAGDGKARRQDRGRRGGP